MNSKEKLFDICEKHRIPSCHSNFQIANFIIGKETSLIAKQWQCLRELQARKDNLELIDDELEELADNIKLAKIDLDLLATELEIKKSSLESEKTKIMISKKTREISKLKKGQKQIELKKQDLMQEINTFISIFEELNKESHFLEYNNNQAQLEYWSKKFETELNLNSFMNSPISGELIKSILALPEQAGIRKQVLDTLTNMNKKLLQQSI